MKPLVLLACLVVVPALAFRSDLIYENYREEENQGDNIYLRQPKATHVSTGFQRSGGGSGGKYSRRRKNCTPRSPCGVCEADCDEDSDCDGDLRCFTREPGDPIVPEGCPGKESYARDYCYDPFYEPAERGIKKFENVVCNPGFLCTMCEGPCDTDDDCKGRYKCFKRDREQSVPGCKGGNNDDSKTKYCYDPDFEKAAPMEPPADLDMYPEVDGQGREHCQPDAPCAECEGDCDEDEDCKGTLVCYKRGSKDVVPGCKGGASDKKGTDYCVQPSSGTMVVATDEQLPELKGQGDEDRGCDEDDPCDNCEGNCSKDQDCKDRLVCFPRNAKEEVPGCQGGSEDETDTHYCIEKFAINDRE